MFESDPWVVSWFFELLDAGSPQARELEKALRNWMSRHNLKADWVLDVSNPNAPVDITPQHASGYWGWYYEFNPTGFRWSRSGTGVFWGSHLYRSSFGAFDVHQWVGGTVPTANFSWTSDEPDGNVYPGSTVDFQDHSTGSPTS